MIALLVYCYPIFAVLSITSSLFAFVPFFKKYVQSLVFFGDGSLVVVVSIVVVLVDIVLLVCLLSGTVRTELHEVLNRELFYFSIVAISLFALTGVIAIIQLMYFGTS